VPVAVNIQPHDTADLMLTTENPELPVLYFKTDIKLR
jgi:hypothetical protein